MFSLLFYYTYIIYIRCTKSIETYQIMSVCYCIEEIYVCYIWKNNINSNLYLLALNHVSNYYIFNHAN